MSNPTLFDGLTPAKAARDEAMQRVDDHAEEDWQTRALDALHTIALRQRTLLANDVWELVERPHEPRATGPLMMKAKKEGWIEATDSYMPVPSVKSHAAPVRVWRSLIYRGDR